MANNHKPTEEELKRQAASLLGRIAGKESARRKSPKERTELARKAAKARWKKNRANQ